MSELDDLYQELILDHSRSPRNFREMAGASHAEGYNPLCGDHFHVWVDVVDGKVRDASFKGAGCAISTSSASLMTEALKGASVADADALFDAVHLMVTGDGEPDPDRDLGKLEVFHNVRNFPLRVKCAILAWHTMKAALHGEQDTVTTE